MDGKCGSRGEGPLKVLLVCSSGGHLQQVLCLESWWRKHERLWVTFDTLDARSLLQGERTVWAFHPTTRSIPNLLRNLRLAWSVLRRERPDLIVSTGAGVAVPFFLLARLFRARTAFVETYDFIDLATLTGRLCAPFSDVFLLQWEEQKANYRHGSVIGTLL
jgi:UDP-N-acetylglucosamine:LPS N-acetylglucosamine transferase